MDARTARWGLVGGLLVLFILSMGLFGYGNIRSGMPLVNVLLSLLILGIPLAVLYLSIGLIVMAWQQHRRQGRLSGRIAHFVYRTPRIGGLLVVVFVSLFALDVFELEGSLWMKIGSFFIHAVPAIFVAGLLALAWRREWIGALAFGLAALFFMRFVIFSPMYGLGNLLLFVLPMALVAVLFWLNWRWRAELRQT